MPINKTHLEKYLNDIVREIDDVQSVLTVLSKSDEEILGDRHLLKSLKYSTIVIAEAIGGIFQHVLAKHFSVAISGYTEAFVKAKDHEVISKELIERLMPFARFRNMIIHQYWRVEDRLFLKNIREGMEDFAMLVREVTNRYMERSGEK